MKNHFLFKKKLIIIFCNYKNTKYQVKIDINSFKKISSINNWFVQKHGGILYSYGYDNNKQIAMHRYLFNNPDQFIDHINHDGLDNRKENLRVVSHGMNLLNSRISKINKSGFKGLFYDKYWKKWVIQMAYNNKILFKFRFKSKKLAIEQLKYLRNKYEKIIFGEFKSSKVLEVVK